MHTSQGIINGSLTWNVFGEDVFLSCEHQRLSCVSCWIICMGWTSGLSLSSGQCLVPPAQSWHVNWYHLIKGKTRAKQAAARSFAGISDCKSSIRLWTKNTAFLSVKNISRHNLTSTIRICICTTFWKGFCYVDLFFSPYLFHKGLQNGLQKHLWL